MNKLEEEIYEKLKNVKKIADRDLSKEEGSKTSSIQNVKYLGKITLKNKDGNEEEHELFIAEEFDYDLDKITERLYLDDKKLDFTEFIKQYESIEPINDTLKEYRERTDDELSNEKEDDKTDEDKIYDLNSLEQEKEKEDELSIDDDESNKDIENKDLNENTETREYKIGDTTGEISLNELVDGIKLDALLGIEGKGFTSIKPVDPKSIGVQSNARYVFVGIRSDKTCEVLGDDILEEDRQEGMNPSDKDKVINNDGTTSEKSSIAGFKVSKHPQYALSIGYEDGNTQTKEVRVAHRSGRNNTTGEIEKELHHKGDSRMDWDARYSQKAKGKGIYEADEMKEKYEEHEEIGCEDIRVEDIDNNKDNDTHEHVKPDEKIPDTDVTWEEFAEICGYRDKDKIEKAYDRFMEYKESERDLSNEEIIEEIEDEIIGELPGRPKER